MILIRGLQHNLLIEPNFNVVYGHLVSVRTYSVMHDIILFPMATIHQLRHKGLMKQAVALIADGYCNLPVEVSVGMFGLIFALITPKGTHCYEPK